ncbi:tetratricopeptide repeat protein [Pseudoalteromonas sp. NZS127]|uniref:Membrane protein with Tetratricopeptide repeat domain n=1 Tax=Pseudoalteromonas translucida (strain TAC 125) TaxID=326442 RepID=Q3ICU4_PSET1|nr:MULTISPECIES: tetratricopeptide repeat protein [Pseudoalteromonas]MBB1406434.1 tetratricopeptide repeat protein [Pseudoalteromonas sp. SG44-5]MBH0072241.1 tetratricopeptide repeat protein [Pseudoalteromonas sp. NZS127]MBH0094348.1 tetratricopeptide repeat protein [Pseudoalteromonas sp. SCQQ13]MBO7927893.1 tetratricopeptide repeat protein [Pseudoalteromonas sp. K222D]CAI89136.1 putative membrane protein with Tetratricopeptide repeat domain [Pseudoalteromonas translucida]
MRYFLLLLFICVTFNSTAIIAAEDDPFSAPTEQQQNQAVDGLAAPMYKPLMERYILDELRAVRQDQQKLREDVTKQVTHAQLDTADRAITYTTDTINNVFFIITATASILVLVGWNSLRDVKNKVEDIVNTRVSVITDEYEDRLKILEEKLRVRSEEILSNQERISVTNEVHSLWMRANLESDFANKIEIFDEILKRKPEDVEAIAYKADALLEINDTAQAIELCNQAIEIDSDYGYAYWQRACAYALIHEHADALADIKMALDYSPNLRNELLHESAFASLHDNESFNEILSATSV